MLSFMYTAYHIELIEQKVIFDNIIRKQTRTIKKKCFTKYQ